MKNKLSLKVLKQEIERLKAHKDSTIKKDIGHDIKHSYINRLYTKSSALWLYLLTGVLGYAHRIPYIGRIVSLLSLWYGRTTIWKILVKIRKAFIVFNALIGVYIVFKSVGFSTDNLIGGIYGVGHTYLESFYRMTKGIFYWFVELFDHKVIPNIPGDDTPKYPSLPVNSYKYPQPKLYDFSDAAVKSRDIFGFFDTVETPSKSWYRDSGTWFWIVGAACAIGLGILGYKMITDPTILEDLLSRKPKGGEGSPSGPTINVTDASVSASTSRLGKARDIGIELFRLPGRLGGVVINKLNPFNYIVGASELQEQFSQFMVLQNDPHTADLRYYPFTTVNPYDSWLTQIKKHLFSESVAELIDRKLARTEYDRTYRSMGGTLGETLWSNRSSIQGTGANTPASITNVGLKNFSTSGVVETLANINADIIDRKIASIPGTPKTLAGDWADHTKATDAESISWMDEFQARRMRPGAYSSSWRTKSPVNDTSADVSDAENNATGALDSSNRYAILNSLSRYATP